MSRPAERSRQCRTTTTPLTISPGTATMRTSPRSSSSPRSSGTTGTARPGGCGAASPTPSWSSRPQAWSPARRWTRAAARAATRSGWPGRAGPSPRWTCPRSPWTGEPPRRRPRATGWPGGSAGSARTCSPGPRNRAGTAWSRRSTCTCRWRCSGTSWPGWPPRSGPAAPCWSSATTRTTCTPMSAVTARPTGSCWPSSWPRTWTRRAGRSWSPGPSAAGQGPGRAARHRAGHGPAGHPPRLTGRGMRIEPMTGAHADGVLEIYRAGIDEGNATFETRAPSWPEFSAARLPAHRFVALGPEPDGERMLGWVAVSPVSSRPVYAGVVEHSVYVHPRRPRPGRRPGPAGRAHRRHRGGRDLDHRVRDLPGEHRQPGPAPGGRVPCGGHPAADRLPPGPPRPPGRLVAGHDTDRAPQRRGRAAGAGHG